LAGLGRQKKIVRDVDYSTLFVSDLYAYTIYNRTVNTIIPRSDGSGKSSYMNMHGNEIYEKRDR
jgi:hypothetical protein